MSGKVFPAGAGVILIETESKLRDLSFPRRCGGDPLCEPFVLIHSKFSPQVRG